MTDFSDRIATLATRSKTAERQALTEEATKTSVILPFIQALGFDVFNLEEVVPEFISDVGTKKGEKVDFAVKIDGKIAMLIEVKPISSKLGDAHYSQLFRYFHTTEARLGILTNGREAWFFSDTEAANKMDKEPFFRFNFQNPDRKQVEELSRFQKSSFAIDSIIEAASNLKYIQGAVDYLKRQLENADEDFVRLVGRQIYDGMLTKTVMEQLKPAIHAALDEIIRDRIEDKLNIKLRDDTATNSAPASSDTEPASLDNSDGDTAIQTTTEEIEGFMIIRAIAARVSPVDRIVMRDAKSYCAILMDDNNRRPICRLYMNSPTTKYIGIFDANKTETKHRIDRPEDLYRYASAIESAVGSYLS